MAPVEGKWLVAEYYTLSDEELKKWPGQIGIKWYQPIITVPAVVVEPRPAWWFAEWPPSPSIAIQTHLNYFNLVGDEL